MSKKNGNSDVTRIKGGFVPSKRGYKPSGGAPTGGHKPEKSEGKPVNPPKKK